jgi:hypothetical protein
MTDTQTAPEPVRHEVTLTCPQCKRGVLAWDLDDETLLVKCLHCVTTFYPHGLEHWNALSAGERTE